MPGERRQGIVADDLGGRGSHQRRRFENLLVVVLPKELDQAREGAARQGLLVDTLGDGALNAQDGGLGLRPRQVESARQIADRLAVLRAGELPPDRPAVAGG